MKRKKSGLLILAGGNSHRMGFPKAFLEYENEIFVNMICKLYEGIVEEFILVLNQHFGEKKWRRFLQRLPDNMICIMNSEQKNDRIHSLRIGLQAFSGERCFVHNVDNPFVSRYVITRLAESSVDRGVIIPMAHGHSGHPVLINHDVISELKEHRKLKLRLNEFYSRFHREYIETGDDSILININTPEDYERIASDVYSLN